MFGSVLRLTVHDTIGSTLDFIVVQVRIIEHQLVPNLIADLPNWRCRIVVVTDLDCVVLVVFFDVIQFLSHRLIIADSGGGCIIQMKIFDEDLGDGNDYVVICVYRDPPPLWRRFLALRWRHMLPIAKSVQSDLRRWAMRRARDKRKRARS